MHCHLLKARQRPCGWSRAEGKGHRCCQLQDVTLCEAGACGRILDVFSIRAGHSAAYRASGAVLMPKWFG